MRNIILASIFGVLIISGSIFYTLRKPVITLDTQESGTQATTTAEMTAIPLVGTQWVWLHTELPANKILSTPNREQYVLTFDTTGRVQSSTDCNTFIGKYVQDGEILSVGPLASTKKACADSLETDYSKELMLATSYQIMGNRMYINMNRDAGRMVFEQK